MSTVYDVKVIDLVKRYKELVAIEHLSIDIKKGEVFGLLGPNGSGKTTLIHCILALLEFDNGEVHIFNEKMTPTSKHIKQEIGLVPQEPAVYDELTVYENIDYFCGLYVSDKKKREECVEWAIDFVQLNEFRKFHPKKLSGGLLRRLNLACGIAHKPKLIFFDEPTVAVDPQSRNKILEGIKQLNKEGATVIYTSHYMEEVEFLCDRLAILDKGKILVEGTSKDIIAMSSLAQSVDIVAYEIPEEVIKYFENQAGVSQVSYEDATLSLKLKRENGNLLDILHRLEEAKVSPVSVQSQKPSLNDVFLEITGKDLRDHA